MRQRVEEKGEKCVGGGKTGMEGKSTEARGGGGGERERKREQKASKKLQARKMDRRKEFSKDF
jgi:hypothetical protein